MYSNHRWQRVKTRQSYHDADIIDVTWTQPDELCVKLGVILEISLSGEGAIYFSGVKNRHEIDEVLRENPDFSRSPWRGVAGFVRLPPDQFSLGPLEIRAANFYEA